MAASKLKNRRRFITRDVRLDIPEDREFTMSAENEDNARHLPFDVQNTGSLDRTWPRRTWRFGSDFVSPAVGVVAPTLTLPRLHFGGAYEDQSAPARSGHYLAGCQSPERHRLPWLDGNNTSPVSAADPGWRFRSLSDAVSSACLSTASSPSETASEPGFKSKSHDEVVDEADTLSFWNSSVQSSRDRTPSAARSFPDLNDVSCITPTSGIDTKPRSYSLNDNSVNGPFFHRVRSTCFPQPGSVLHRARTWEMASKSQPFRVVVSSSGERRSPDSGFRRNASAGQLEIVPENEMGAFDNRNGTHSSRESTTKYGQPEAVAWVDKESRLTVQPDMTFRLSSDPPTLQSSNCQSESTEQRGWNTEKEYSVTDTDQARDTISEALRNSFDVGRSDTIPTNGYPDSPGKDLTWLTSLRSDHFPSDSIDICETETLIPSVRQNTFREVDSSNCVFSFPVSQNNLLSEIYDDSFSVNRKDFPTKTVQGRKPFRSESLKLLNSKGLEPVSARDGKVSAFHRQLLDWRREDMPLSTPNSPPSPSTETTQKQMVKTTLSKPCRSMITLDTYAAAEKEKPAACIPLRPSALFRFTTGDLPGHESPPRTATREMEPGQELKTANAKPFGSNFVIKRLTNLTINPFVSTVTVKEPKECDLKINEFFPATDDATKLTKKSNDLFPKTSQASAEALNEVEPNFRNTEFEKSAKNEVEFSFAYESGKQQRAESGVTEAETLTGSGNDRVDARTNCQQFISSKDICLGRSTTENLDASYSEDLCTRGFDPFRSEENRVGYYTSYPLQRNEEQNTRHIRVFTKSSSEPRDEIRQFRSFMGESWVESREDSVNKKRFDTVIPPATKFSDIRNICKKSDEDFGLTLKEFDSFLLDSFSKKSPSEYFPRNGNPRKHSAPTVDNERSNPKLEVDAVGKHITESNRCFLDMKTNGDPQPKKAFEIVKKKLIIPEPISWFSSKVEQSNSTSKPDLEFRGVRSEINLDLGTNGFRRDDKNLADELRNTSKLIRRDEKSTETGRRNADWIKGTVVQNASVPVMHERGFDLGPTVSSDLDVAISRITSQYGIALDTVSEDVPVNHLSGAGRQYTSRSNGDLRSEQPEDELTRWIDEAKDRENSVPTHSTKQLPGTPEVDQERKSTTANPTAYGNETTEFHANIECSIMTELDMAIQKLTATPVENCKTKPAPPGDRKGVNNKVPPTTLQNFALPWVGPSLKPTQSVSALDVRSLPAESCPVSKGLQVKISTSVYKSMPKYASPVNSAHSSCASIAPIELVRVTPKVIDSGTSISATGRRNQWTLQAREDSFNRPDSPLFHHTLPLPKDSVIMRHRMHQKELGCNGNGDRQTGRRSVSSSSSESSEDDSPVFRVAPRRTKKSRHVIVSDVTGTEEATDDVNEEQDSVISSTASIRPLSLDSSFLSEDNL